MAPPHAHVVPLPLPLLRPLRTALLLAAGNMPLPLPLPFLIHVVLIVQCSSFCRPTADAFQFHLVHVRPPTTTTSCSVHVLSWNRPVLLPQQQHSLDLVPPAARNNVLFASSSSSDDSNNHNSNQSNNNNNNSNLSASARERRNEEIRRLSRAADVVPGKTSALPNAHDYALDPLETERAWRAQASDVEREVSLQTERGMRALRLLQLEEARSAFDRVYGLKPEAYLWQAGVVLYYQNELGEAARCFAKNAATFESKFMSPASEERIWRDCCQLRADTLSKRRTRNVRKGEGEDGRAALMLQTILDEAPSVPSSGDDSVSRETRRVIRIARDLFQGSIDSDPSAVALGRAKLRSICGEYGAQPTMDRKKWKVSSWYYLGLHYDAVGEEDDARACMKMALTYSSGGGNGDDIINLLPYLHMSVRDWFDDDEMFGDDDADDYDEDDGGDWSSVDGNTPSIWEKDEPTKYEWSSEKASSAGSSTTSGKKGTSKSKNTPKESKQRSGSSNNNSDQGGARSVVKVAIEASLQTVRLTELQESLRKRGMKISGSKAELQERLLKALLEDAGFY